MMNFVGYIYYFKGYSSLSLPFLNTFDKVDEFFNTPLSEDY